MASYNLESSAAKQQDLLKKLTKPFTQMIVQLDKKVIEGIALGKEEFADKSLIKVGHGLKLVWECVISAAWISNYIHYKVWDEITYLFPNFNSATVEVWEWISYFIPHFIGRVIIYPSLD